MSDGFPNAPETLFKDWRGDSKTLEWKGIKSDVISIDKNDSREAYIFEVNRNEDEFYLQAFGCKPLVLPKEDCTLYLNARMCAMWKVTEFELIVDLGKHINRIIVNTVSATKRTKKGSLH